MGELVKQFFTAVVMIAFYIAAFFFVGHFLISTFSLPIVWGLQQAFGAAVAVFLARCFVVYLFGAKTDKKAVEALQKEKESLELTLQGAAILLQIFVRKSGGEVRISNDEIHQATPEYYVDQYTDVWTKEQVFVLKKRGENE